MNGTVNGSRIFISYRRDDAGAEAGRLSDDLKRTFGEKNVFLDVGGIQLGRDFRKEIHKSVGDCAVLLALIGPQWVSIADADGTSRLSHENDYVRLEIATALSRDIHVIPVLVRHAKLPKKDELPDDLCDLIYRAGMELTLERWHSDVGLLVAALKEAMVNSDAIEQDLEAEASRQRELEQQRQQEEVEQIQREETARKVREKEEQRSIRALAAQRKREEAARLAAEEEEPSLQGSFAVVRPAQPQSQEPEPAEAPTEPKRAGLGDKVIVLCGGILVGAACGAAWAGGTAEDSGILGNLLAMGLLCAIMGGVVRFLSKKYGLRWMSVICSPAFLIGYCFPNGSMSNPHPSFWFAIEGAAIVLAISLIRQPDGSS